MSDLTPEALLDKVLTDRHSAGNERVRSIVNRITTDLFRTVQEMEVTPDEFWAAAGWITRLGASGQTGLITAGLGFDRLMDMMQDAADQRAGRAAGTPRAIEGPLYVPGAPTSNVEARLDDEADVGERFVLEGVVRDEKGQPIKNASVDVWHANEHGRYSHFDPSQAEFHLRRRVITNERGEYRVRSVIPPGYAIPPNSPTSELFTALGRHGNRPAHVHFLISAPGQRTLTTQINLPGDPFLHDDFAYATRDDLVVELKPAEAPQQYASLGMEGPFKVARFDVTLQSARNEDEARHLGRAERVAPAAA